MRNLTLLALLTLAGCGGTSVPPMSRPLPDVGLNVRLSPPMSPDLERALSDLDDTIERSRYDRAINQLELRARLNGY